MLPSVAESWADEELAREVNIRFHRQDMTARRIRAMRSREVLVPGGKGGRGKVTQYPPGSVEIAGAMANAFDVTRLFDRAVLVAWWRQACVGTPALRRALFGELQKTLRKAHDATSGQRSFGHGPEHLGAILPKVPKADRASVMRGINDTMLGDYDSLMGSQATQLLDMFEPMVELAMKTSQLLELDGPDEPTARRDKFRDVLRSFDFSKGIVAAKHASRESLDEVRDFLKQQLEYVEQTSLAGFFGKSDEEAWQKAMLAAVFCGIFEAFSMPQDGTGE